MTTSEAIDTFPNSVADETELPPAIFRMFGDPLPFGSVHAEIEPHPVLCEKLWVVVGAVGLGADGVGGNQVDASCTSPPVTVALPLCVRASPAMPPPPLLQLPTPVRGVYSLPLMVVPPLSVRLPLV